MGMVSILYVEDEVFLGKIVKETLESRGYAVRMETDGRDVAEAFKQFKPDICLLDVMLPGRSGFELAADIRQLDKKVPILFLTAKTQTEDVVKGFSQGGNDYLRKPFSMEELIVRIQNLLQLTGNTQPEKQDPDNIHLGKFTFNLPRQTLTGGEQERKLSFRESELLRYLYEHRNSIIDRRDLLMKIWGNDNFFNSRNLDVYITKLRGYLREDTSLEILTIKGVGYRFVLDNI
jgi:DNA-binding response OmpR family regulator